MFEVSTLVAFFVAISLLGCGLASDMAETQKRAEAVAIALEKEVGVKPFVGWNIHNGKLTNVNISFPLEGVGKLTAAELHAKATAAASANFDKAPEQLVVATFSKK
jgi:hypothetical protein